MRTWHTLSPSPLPIRLGQTDVFHLALFVTVTPFSDVFRPPSVVSALPGDESRSANPVLKYLGRVVLPRPEGSGGGRVFTNASAYQV